MELVGEREGRAGGIHDGHVGDLFEVVADLLLDRLRRHLRRFVAVCIQPRNKDIILSIMGVNLGGIGELAGEGGARG